MKTLLLWDIDGTLLRNKGAGKRAMNRAFAKMTGEEGAFDSIDMAGGLDLNMIGGVFARYGVDASRMEEFLTLYYPCLEDVMRDGNSKLMPNVVQVLERAERDARFYNAYGTGNVERGARIKLEHFDLNRFFPVGGFCYGPVERWQLLQDGIERAQQHYGVEFAPERVIVIGDTLKDIEAARKIGAKVVAVGTGGHAYDVLAAAEPDLLLADMTDEERFFAFCSE
ncbi:HAD family hydrolase [Tumebacillus avium]|nr:HAD hydrolase-like protein [Tumebacillus avium]